MLQNVRKSRALDGPMSRYDQLECFFGCALLKTDMTSALSNNHPTIPPERPNHPIIIQARHFGHTGSSTISASGAKCSSSSTGSR